MIRATKKSIQPGRILYGLLLLSFLIIVAACDDIPNKFETEDNFVPITAYIYENEEEYSSFIKVIEASNMVDALSAYNPNGEKYTLFLPTNEAFERFFQESDVYKSLDDLIADVETVNAFSRYHVANVMVYSNDFPLGALPDTTLTGDYLTIAYIEGEDSTYFKVNNLALVEIEDLEMANGVIHVIDHVLEPITYSAYE